MATFGNLNFYATYTGIGGAGLISGRFQLTEDGTVTLITARLSADNTKNCKAAIYNDLAGEPNALQGFSSNVAVSSAAWYDFAVNIQLTAGWYHLTIFLGDSSCKISYTTGGTTDYTSPMTYDGFPTTYPTHSNSTLLISIYGTYTPAGVGQQLFTLINEMEY